MKLLKYAKFNAHVHAHTRHREFRFRSIYLKMPSALGSFPAHVGLIGAINLTWEENGRRKIPKLFGKFSSIAGNLHEQRRRLVLVAGDSRINEYEEIFGAILSSVLFHFCFLCTFSSWSFMIATHNGNSLMESFGKCVACVPWRTK